MLRELIALYAINFNSITIFKNIAYVIAFSNIIYKGNIITFHTLPDC